MNIHLIAMGGSVMHALAVALKKQGHNVSGSDDQFFDPAKSALKKAGILPEAIGWQPGRVSSNLDLVILGMHAQKENPELLQAQKLGLPIYSFPEYVYEHSKNKQRIVIGGSHGKTTITSMVMHVLKYHHKKFDYIVGANVDGFDNRVKLSDDPIIIIEGDEYLSSRIDETPKLLRYKHHVGVISGIAWDHINVFKKEKDYIEQFIKFADATPKAGSIIYNEEDELANDIGSKERMDVGRFPYKALPAKIKNGKTSIETSEGQIPVQIFGSHNLLNLSASKNVLERLGIDEKQFYEAIPSFKLPSLRLDTLLQKNGLIVYRDYAHAPSKVKATTQAVKAQTPDKKLIGLLELHTYSSLNKAFLPHYNGSLDSCDEAIVFFDPEAIELKRLESITEQDVKNSFGKKGIKVVNSAEALESEIKSLDTKNANLLLMSSGNFGGLNFESLLS